MDAGAVFGGAAAVVRAFTGRILGVGASISDAGAEFNSLREARLVGFADDDREAL